VTWINARWPALGIALVILTGLLFYFFGNGYGRLSERGYQHALSIMSACNRKDTPRVQTIDAMLRQDVTTQQLKPTEARWLMKITQTALDGNWVLSSQQVRRLLEDQIESASLPQ
jgi:hypothetical protein